ncbi:MAG TPA: DUF2059 domain-containing protein [Thermoanaerobaculia bacterium]|nr:DUF2059 domain-containing protein [Thermoanaerobaculia bacterium]
MRILRNVVAVVSMAAAGTGTFVAEQGPTSPQGRELYKTLGGDRLMLQSLEAILSIAGRDPKVAPYEGVIRAWLENSMSTSHFEDDMSRYYSTTFTDKELKDILAFLKTPTGQKLVNQLPGVIQHGANLSGVMMEQNRANLEQAMGKRRSDSGRTRR